MAHTSFRLIALAGSLACAPIAAQPRFIPIGDIPGGLALGSVQAVSADGTFAAGDGISATDRESFRWSEADGLEVVPGIPGGSSYDLTGMSPSGEYLVGRYTRPEGGALSYVWSPSTGTTSVGPLPDQGTPTWLNAVSDEGVAVGSSSVGRTSTGSSLNRAVQWTASGGLEMLPLPSPADANQGSTAQAVLADGRIFGASASGRWLYSDDTGFEIFSPEASLERINSDGTLLTGTVTFPGMVPSLRAAYWTEATGRQFLEPYIDNGEPYGVQGISDDGSVIFGGQNTVGEIIWIDRGPPVTFADYVASLGVDMMGHTISDVRAVSADGSTFVGTAFSLQSGTIAFALVVPAPGVLPVACVGLLALRRRR